MPYRTARPCRPLGHFLPLSLLLCLPLTTGCTPSTERQGAHTDGSNSPTAPSVPVSGFRMPSASEGKIRGRHAHGQQNRTS